MCTLADLARAEERLSNKIDDMQTKILVEIDDLCQIYTSNGNIKNSEENTQVNEDNTIAPTFLNNISTDVAVSTPQTMTQMITTTQPN